MEETMAEHLVDAAPVLKEFIGQDRPVCAFILGSGLNSFANRLEEARFLNYHEVPHMKCSTAEGHVGRFVLGTVPGTGKRVLCMQGRLHAYEGNTPHEVAFPVWLMKLAGIELIFTTNAAGAINPSYRVGDFCLMKDQINLTGRNPLVGVQPTLLANRFVPMYDAFDPILRKLVLDVAEAEGVTVHEGVYIGLLGPSFETPAEIRAFGLLGADTVAMSVVEEVIAARHVEMKVVGMSLISNMACGVEGGDPRPDDVMEAAKHAEDDFARIAMGFVKALGRQE